MKRLLTTYCLLLTFSLLAGCGGSEIGNFQNDTLTLMSGIPEPTLENSYEVPLTRTGSGALRYGWNTFTFPAIGAQKFSATTLTYMAQTQLLRDGGAGIYANDFCLLVNCNITGNIVKGKEGYNYGGGGFLLSGQDPKITYSNFYGNLPDNARNNMQSDSGGVEKFADWGWDGTGCISGGPLFVDPVHYNYHLQAGSPCLDAGDPSYDGYLLDGDWETQTGIADGAPVDIGYHYPH
jgi:hypothetical protein